jgi:RNA polymerase sigma-70 factor (ECF subfamily)
MRVRVVGVTSKSPDQAQALPSGVPIDFDTFFVAEYAGLVRLAWILTGRREVAEEQVQEAFVSAHARWGRVSRLQQPSAWMRRVVTNRCISTLRRRAIELRVLGQLRESEALALPAESEEVWSAVRRLPRRQAQVVALVYLEDRSIRDVASILGCSDATARTHLRRARARLAAGLGVIIEEEIADA